MKKELPIVKGKVIARFEPSPSGPLHIGHIYGLCLNSEFAKKNKGKMILRISDTNPENIYDKAYDLIVKDAKWVTKNGISEVVIQSSRLGIYYDYAEKLVDMEKAYVCTCDADKFRELINRMEACSCRNLSKKENQLRFAKMFSEYKEGEAVLRIKTDIKHKNPAIRDWPAMRINEAIHPKTKKEFRVWPLMNFAVAVDDIDMGLTHVIRGKDHMANGEKQKYIYNYLNKKIPEFIYLGMINFQDLKLSTSETRKQIEYGTYTGWDDLRLPFLPALRRRGYQPEAFINYALDVGFTEVDKTVSKEEFFKIINFFNKQVIDKKAKRYFFVENPKKLKIRNLPKISVEAPLHPDNKKMGVRKLKIKDEFFIQDKLEKGIVYRLMHAFNFKDGKFISTEHDKELKAKLIHWVPADKFVDVEVYMDDGSIKKGVGEENLKNVRIGETIQFERFAFVRCEKTGKVYKFVFLHR